MIVTPVKLFTLKIDVMVVEATLFTFAELAPENVCHASGSAF
jgi:hypothetical protein